jgi:hypothetical protein
VKIMDEETTKFAFYHINKGNFKDTKDHYWLVGFNEGGIGTAILDVTPDVVWFMGKAVADFKKDAEKLAEAAMKDIEVAGMTGNELQLRLKTQMTLTQEIEDLKKSIRNIRLAIRARIRAYDCDMQTQPNKEYFEACKSALIEFERKLKDMKYIDEYVDKNKYLFAEDYEELTEEKK